VRLWRLSTPLYPWWRSADARTSACAGHHEILRAFGSTPPSKLGAEDGSLGLAVRETLVGFLDALGEVPRGLSAVGYTDQDVGSLVEGMLPQKRVLSLAPNVADLEGEGREQLEGIIRSSLEWWAKRTLSEITDRPQSVVTSETTIHCKCMLHARRELMSVVDGAALSA
jgi:hypothetical protein